MSFSELLKKARNNEIEELVHKSVANEEKVVEKSVEEVKSQEPVYIELGEAIIRTSAYAKEKYKKLKRGTNASLRIAKGLASGQLKKSQFDKAWLIQKRYNEKRADWHLVGGKAMQLLKKAIEDDNIPLEKALKLPIEIKG